MVSTRLSPARARDVRGFVALLLTVSVISLAAAPAMQVVKATGTGTPLLMNGNFESLQQGEATPWTGWHQGYRLATAEGRGGSRCITCERKEGEAEFGASQTLTLNRTNTAPFIIRGWSKAQDVSGSPDNGYSLYVDILFADGTSLWAQSANFTCGTHDWERREFVLLPDKPVKLFTLHCLFRGHTGKVWFDDAAVEEVPTPAGAVLFQGVSVQASHAQIPNPKTRSRKLATRDGLKLTLRDNAITSLRVGGKELAGSAPSGFLARDHAADSDVYGFTGGLYQELGLKLDASFNAGNDHITIQGRVSDTTGRDRAVTLLFALPVAATGWQWGDDVRRSRRIEGSGEFANMINVRSGANGKMSLYPLAAIWTTGTALDGVPAGVRPSSGAASSQQPSAPKYSGRTPRAASESAGTRVGLALALDMDHPAQYRLVYHAGTEQFFIAYDFGLTKDTTGFPGSAEFRFVLYAFDPRWGFRSALQKYYDLFPQHFTKRVTREGLWMPFTDIATVPGFEDFGFAFQEGGGNVPFDDQHSIASFVYVEPTSHWLAMPPGVPRTYESAMAVLQKDLAGARGKEAAKMAAATLTSSVEDPNGRFFLYLVKAPWCDGGVFALNPDPDIPTTPDRPYTKAKVMQETIAAAFKKNEPPTQPSTLNPQPPPAPTPASTAFTSTHWRCPPAS